MDVFSLSNEEKNLVLIPGVQVTASVMHPTGGGAATPTVLLNDIAHRLDDGDLNDFSAQRTYDTFHGRNERNELDWYELDFPLPVNFNCLEMTMGYPYRDGGWWTSFNVEVRRVDSSQWEPVSHLRISPEYNFADSRINRRLFETYVIWFDDVFADAVKIIGVPGGLVQFSSLARLAVFHRDLSQWKTAQLVHTPLPHIYRLIPPNSIWDLSSGLRRLTNLGATFPLLEYYLDEKRSVSDWSREVEFYTGKPYLEMVVGDVIGWDTYPRIAQYQHHYFPTSVHPAPYIELAFGGSMARALAPVIINEQTLAHIHSDQALIRNPIDWAWHQDFAAQYAIPWHEYQAALERSPRMSLEQMEGVAEILGMISNTVAQIASRNLSMEHELSRLKESKNRASLERDEIIQQAIQFFQNNLEEEINISDAARHVNLNPSYFSTIFAEQTGSSPTDLLQHLRIERAKEYFRHTTLSVMDVCIALHYTPSYFNRLFKKIVGMTPGEFARQQRQVT